MELYHVVSMLGVFALLLLLEVTILALDTRAIRAEKSDQASSRTSQWYEKRNPKRGRRHRSNKWFKKHVRCTPKAFDAIVNRIKPIFYKRFPLYRNAQFSIEHRVAVTLNYLNVGDFGISGAFFGMSQSSCYRSVQQVAAKHPGLTADAKSLTLNRFSYVW